MALSFAGGPTEPFTFRDLDAMPDDRRRWELIGGSLVVSPASSSARWPRYPPPVRAPTGPRPLNRKGGSDSDSTFTTSCPFPVGLWPDKLAWRG